VGLRPRPGLTHRVFDNEPRVSREVGLTALQLWQATLSHTGRGRGEREVTILFTDLVGFSSWALGAGDDDALPLLRRVATALEPPVAAHRGKVVKRLGDGVMAVFPTPQTAWKASAGEVLASETTVWGLDKERVQSRRKKTFAFRSVKGVPADLGVVVVTPR
jgi:adenylate cyclase